MSDQPFDTIAQDIERVGRIDVIPKILEVCCRTTGMGFAAVARVTADRWVALAVRDEINFGLAAGGELEVKSTICDEIRDSGQPVLIDHVAEDPLFRDHHTPRHYGLQSYVSVPIRHRGRFFGTLCAIDPSPHKVKSPEIQGMFELFADLVGGQLDSQDQLALSEAALLDAREVAELREQFIAVLGHDLRNPLASIDAGARLIGKTQLEPKATALLALMQGSVRRMAGLIDNVLDLARGRLGGGFTIERRVDDNLGAALDQVIAELATAHPDRKIDVQIGRLETVALDTRRVAQLFSNLLANAISHGQEGTPVRVNAVVTDGQFELSVANEGEPIPQAAMAQLFQPFTRAALRPHQEGLGLGLYISAEIARAHGGTLTVNSDAQETRFTLKVPTA